MDDKVEGEGVDASGAAGHLDRVRAELRRVERLLTPGAELVDSAHTKLLVPAWRRVTQGEQWWPVSVAIFAAIAMQIALPGRFAPHIRWMLPTLEAILLVGLIIANPRRLDRESPVLRLATIALIAVISVANAWAAAHLVYGVIHGSEDRDPGRLLLTGASIWLTNVVVFALWYWDLDRGGPVARAHATKLHPDFLFPQMQNPEFAPPEWEAGFVDYFYVSFTNATAFSPTDVLPLTQWAKLTMMLQSAVSLSTVALVIARAVNILK